MPDLQELEIVRFIEGGGPWMIPILIALIVCSLLLALSPYFIARSRMHANAEAIGICGFLGFYTTFGILWMIGHRH